MKSLNSIIAFIKKETVLSVAWIMAVISAFIIHPSADYLSYIDFRSLGILWSLMIIMAGLQKSGFFSEVGEKLLEKTKCQWQLVLVLVMLCFFFSMLITNDVALITFVPFSIFMLEACHKSELMIPVIALQTVAANLGSMLTPVGNPQNLYLYGLSEMSMASFISLMLPYTLTALVLILIFIFTMRGKREAVALPEEAEVLHFDKKATVFYGLLFLFSLLVVARLIPYYILAALVLLVVFVIDKRILTSIDYALLFTFVGFFIFTGNMGNIPAVNHVLTDLIEGSVTEIAIILSQVISNVPAALLVSAFTEDYQRLIIGVNLGGLGTLIASMASLISFKLLAHHDNAKKGKYLGYFTRVNILYLVILYFVYRLFA